MNRARNPFIMMGLTVFADDRDGATCGSYMVDHWTIIAQLVAQWISLTKIDGLPSVIAGARIKLLTSFITFPSLTRGDRAQSPHRSYRGPNDALNRAVSFCFRFNPHPASLDRPIGRPHNNLDKLSIDSTIDDVYTWGRLLTAVTSIILPDFVNIVIIVVDDSHRRVWTSRPRICQALYRAPVYPSRCPVPLFASLFHVYLPLHLSAAALHTLSPATNPVIGRRAYPHDFPYPHPPSLTPRASATFCTRFLYLLREFTDNTTGSITMSAPFLDPRWKSSSITRTFVVFSTTGSIIRGLRYVFRSIGVPRILGQSLIYIPALLITTLLSRWPCDNFHILGELWSDLCWLIARNSWFN